MFTKRNRIDNPGLSVEIRRLKGTDEAKRSAQMMANSEPWVLTQDFKASLKMITDPSRVVYLALAGNVIAGFVIVDMNSPFFRAQMKEPVVYIQAVCVKKEFRNRGIGTQLIGFAERRVPRRVEKVCICTSPCDRLSRRLYERLGYEAVDQLGDTDILMAKKVAEKIGLSLKGSRH